MSGSALEAASARLSPRMSRHEDEVSMPQFGGFHPALWLSAAQACAMQKAQTHRQSPLQSLDVHERINPCDKKGKALDQVSASVERRRY